MTTAARSAMLMASQPPVTNGTIVSYTVSYHVNGSTDIRTMNFTAINQFLDGTVTSLLPFTTYVFSVRACTSVACSQSSNNVTEMTLEDGEFTLSMLIIQITDKKYIFKN